MVQPMPDRKIIALGLFHAGPYSMFEETASMGPIYTYSRRVMVNVFRRLIRSRFDDRAVGIL